MKEDNEVYQKMLDDLNAEFSADFAKQGNYYGPAGELPYEEAPECLCGTWLRGRSVNMIHSRAGAGKTALLFDLIHAMKTGGQWLGQDTKDPGKILFVNGDMDRWEINERLEGMRDLTGFDLWQVPFTNLLERPEKLLEFCDQYDMVIFDNRACLFQLQDVNSPESWDALIDLMRKMAIADTCVILVTHSGKGEGSSSFGSSAQEWLIRTNLGITTKDDQKYVEFQKVRGPQPKKTPFYLMKEFSGRLAAIEGENPEPTVTPAVSDNKDLMLNYITNCGPVSWNDIRAKCRRMEGPIFCNEKLGRAIVSELVKQGWVKQTPKGYECNPK